MYITFDFQSIRLNLHSNYKRHQSDRILFATEISTFDRTEYLRSGTFTSDIPYLLHQSSTISFADCVTKDNPSLIASSSWESLSFFRDEFRKSRRGPFGAINATRCFCANSNRDEVLGCRMSSYAVVNRPIWFRVCMREKRLPRI